MKIDRLMHIVTLLLQQDQVTAPALAARFEVSRRTISRDLEALCHAGIPIVTTQGRGGGISIAPGYRIDKSLLSQDELQMIRIGLRGMDSVSQTSFYRDLLDKLTDRPVRLIANDVVQIDLSSFDRGPIAQKIETIQQAIAAHHILSFQYYYEKGESRRTIEPYYLLFRWSAWYVFGYCLDRHAFRMFKLNRLCDLSASDRVFVPRDVPEAALHANRYFSSEVIHLKAAFQPSARHRLIDEYGIESFTVQSDGTLLFERGFVSYSNLRDWILSFGDQVCIHAPARLRDDRLEQAKNILRAAQET